MLRLLHATGVFVRHSRTREYWTGRLGYSKSYCACATQG